MNLQNRPTPQPNQSADPATPTAGPKAGFGRFYTQVFLPEHQQPANVALHVLGTVLALVWLPAAVLAGLPWLVLLFRVVHAAPGLLGHRFFERNAAVGDVRVTRTDYSPLWFIAANHCMSWQLLTRGFYWRAQRP